MRDGFSLFPEAASSVAESVDRLYLFEVLVSLFFSVLIAALVVGFAVRYRRRANVPATQIHGSLRLELLWTLIPFAIAMGMFFWGAVVYFDMRRMPAEGMRFLVTAKQWMWKIQHPTGHREINEMHVPVGRTVLMTMTSEDVIHDFFVPAFRVKYDVLPGRYTAAWFTPTKVGRYHLFCAEYCGTKHSEMIGSIVVMEPADYEAWLDGQPAAKDPAEAGALLFEKHRCNTCHDAGAGQRGPALAGVWGSVRPLQGGGTAVADAEYVRRSIVRPKAEIVAGYEPLMPTYQGQITEEEILQIVAYVESLGAGAEETESER